MHFPNEEAAAKRSDAAHRRVLVVPVARLPLLPHHCQLLASHLIHEVPQVAAPPVIVHAPLQAPADVDVCIPAVAPAVASPRPAEDRALATGGQLRLVNYPLQPAGEKAVNLGLSSCGSRQCSNLARVMAGVTRYRTTNAAIFESTGKLYDAEGNVRALAQEWCCMAYHAFRVLSALVTIMHGCLYHV